MTLNEKQLLIRIRNTEEKLVNVGQYLPKHRYNELMDQMHRDTRSLMNKEETLSQEIQRHMSLYERNLEAQTKQNQIQ